LKTNELKYDWSDYADFFDTDYVTETNDMHTIDLAFRGMEGKQCTTWVLFPLISIKFESKGLIKIK